MKGLSEVWKIKKWIACDHYRINYSKLTGIERRCGGTEDYNFSQRKDSFKQQKEGAALPEILFLQKGELEFKFIHTKSKECCSKRTFLDAKIPKWKKVQGSDQLQTSYSNVNSFKRIEDMYECVCPASGLRVLWHFSFNKLKQFK